MKLTIAALFLALAATTLSAQCSLSITGSVNFGQTCSIAFDGTGGNKLVILGASESLGTTTFGSGLFAITLDIAQPLIMLPMGMTNAAGDCTLNITLPAAPTLPAGAPTPTSMLLHCQAVAIGLPSLGLPSGGIFGSLSTCVSNVANVQVF